MHKFFIGGGSIYPFTVHSQDNNGAFVEEALLDLLMQFRNCPARTRTQ